MPLHEEGSLRELDKVLDEATYAKAPPRVTAERVAGLGFFMIGSLALPRRAYEPRGLKVYQDGGWKTLEGEGVYATYSPVVALTTAAYGDVNKQLERLEVGRRNRRFGGEIVRRDVSAYGWKLAPGAVEAMPYSSLEELTAVLRMGDEAVGEVAVVPQQGFENLDRDRLYMAHEAVPILGTFAVTGRGYEELVNNVGFDVRPAEFL